MKVKDFRARISAMMGEIQTIVNESGDIARYLARKYARDGEARNAVSRGIREIQHLKGYLAYYGARSDNEECDQAMLDVITHCEEILRKRHETLAHLRHLKAQCP